MKNILKRLVPLADKLLFPFAVPAALLLKAIRKAGIQRMPFCRKVLFRLGVFPIRDHYYEPQFDNQQTKVDFSKARNLKGIDWNQEFQLQLLKRFVYADELVQAASSKPESSRFSFENDFFRAGDAEYWYQIVRSFKPRRIFEIGSGHSTLMAIDAIRKNELEDPNYKCKHLCVEPYEMPWLEKSGVTVVRRRVEDLDLSFFAELEENDILFIDSSHVIRPHGDVLYEYLELLPSLKKGVIVHIHDIFSPRNYPASWLVDEVRFWNEQYLLEAFLTHNKSWQIIGALNHLKHNFFTDFKKIAPYLSTEHEPGSFYIQKTSL